ncbi:AI-2E family transporter [Bradymonas sediminis]|uniref:Uncharacterized protein n=1 Tax=Bradymonas sediminis TaxID=1548548 RepID=A0A2Z4FPG4_9DELT|nr:AI-2E family transporter [Bradymonas sediminis]AWV90534.1 hypothetical protein DN745_14840 [Bradymonas sediminis]TDP72072.1 uncharacterized protein DUF20 [Bradymonas sediminis]
MSQQLNEPEQSPEESASKQGNKKRWYRHMSRSRRLFLPLLTMGLLALILVLFHRILLPFIFAIAIAYLMNPIVKRMSVRFPRWVAVITVYLAFFGILTAGFVVVVPRFFNEMARFAETVPETVANFRQKNLPGINEKLQNFVREYLPIMPPGTEHVAARAHVASAWTEATQRATATGLALTRARGATNIKFQVDRQTGKQTASTGETIIEVDNGVNVTVRTELPETGGEAAAEKARPKVTYRGVPEPAASEELADYGTHGSWTFVDAQPSAVVRMVPGDKGEVELFLGEGEVVVTRIDDDSWSVQRGNRHHYKRESTPVPATLIDLEARVNQMIEGIVSTSQERITAVISYAHILAVGIIQILVTIILTFMVAAFMSIDLPRFNGFFRDMLPGEYRPGYDDLMRRIDRGLSGVVRGQLIICLINGVLTYIGLALIGVKFSVMLSLLAGVLTLIPVFGTVISTIPIMLVGLMTGFWTSFLAFAWIMFIHFVEANILNPQIIGNSAHIHPVIVIFALLAGESAFGLVGALLAVPVTSILLEIFQFIRDRLTAEEMAAAQEASGSDGSAVGG